MAYSNNSLANLKPWQPGESANPGGRPKRKIVTEMIAKIIDEKIANDPAKRTALEMAVRGLIREAMKGSVPAFREMTDRLEGKAPQAMDETGPDSAAL